MPIAKDAIEEYLTTQYDNHLWMKDLTDKELDTFIDEMEPKPIFPFELRRHQKVCFILAVSFRQFYFQLDMGTGKTSLSLVLLYYFMQLGLVHKALVLAPTNEIVDGWEEEIQKWFGDTLPYIKMQGSSLDKWEIYEAFDRGLAILSYPGMVHLCCEKELIKKRNKKPKNELVPQRYLIDRLLYNVDAVVWDEITKAKDHTSLTWRISNYISKEVSIRFGLAGRSFGRDPQAVWAQFMLTDRGETFSSTLGFFREVFFTEKKSFFGGPYSYEYTFRKEREEDFGRAMGHRSIRYDTEETDIILPPLVASRIRVSLPPASMAYYQRTLKELRNSRGNWQEVQNSFLKLRQISSGFLGFKDDETGEKAQLEFEDNPKLDRLLDLIGQIPDDRKFIIAVDFTWSGIRIGTELRKLKIEHGWLWGGTKDWPTMKKKFDTDKKFRGLIVQSKKGAYGLNLQAANYVLIYESPVGVLDRTQLERRCRRDGQLHTVFQYDLLMRGTTDESILRFHKEGRNLYEALVENPEEVLREE